jgi:DNA replication protein DnaC
MKFCGKCVEGYLAVEDNDGYERLAPCPCKTKGEAMENFLKSVPRRFANAQLETFEWGWLPKAGAPAAAKLRTYMGLVEKTVHGAFALFIHGGVGTGKTHLAVGVGRALVEKHALSARFMPLSEHLAAMKSSFDDPEKDVDDYPNVEILVLDDIGAARGTDWAREYFYNLVNWRYNRMLPTVITSNLSPDAVADALGEAAASRLAQDAVQIFAGKIDRRRNLQKGDLSGK